MISATRWQAFFGRKLPALLSAGFGFTFSYSGDHFDLRERFRRKIVQQFHEVQIYQSPSALEQEGHRTGRFGPAEKIGDLVQHPNDIFAGSNLARNRRSGRAPGM